MTCHPAAPGRQDVPRISQSSGDWASGPRGRPSEGSRRLSHPARCGLRRICPVRDQPAFSGRCGPTDPLKLSTFAEASKLTVESSIAAASICLRRSLLASSPLSAWLMVRSPWTLGHSNVVSALQCFLPLTGVVARVFAPTCSTMRSTIDVGISRSFCNSLPTSVRGFRPRGVGRLDRVKPQPLLESLLRTGCPSHHSLQRQESDTESLMKLSATSPKEANSNRPVSDKCM